MRYVKTGGSRTFRIGGRVYMFGADHGHREKYVYASDVPQLLLTRVLEVVSQPGSEITPMAEPRDDLVTA
jgi:hypothetical protein